MIAFPPGVRVWLATGHTDMRKGFATLALLVQEKLKTDPHGGHLFVFRGRRGQTRDVQRDETTSALGRQADPGAPSQWLQREPELCGCSSSATPQAVQVLRLHQIRDDNAPGALRLIRATGRRLDGSRPLTVTSRTAMPQSRNSSSESRGW